MNSKENENEKKKKRIEYKESNDAKWMDESMWKLLRLTIQNKHNM